MLVITLHNYCKINNRAVIMLCHIFFLFLLVSTGTAIDIEKIIGGNLELLKCKPTIDMVDASGKIPNGILAGNLIDIGAFDQCLSIEHPNPIIGTTKGKYCIVKLNIPLDYLTRNSNKNEFLIDAPVDEMERAVLVSGVNSTGIALGWCVPHNCPIKLLTDAVTVFIKSKAEDFSMEPVLGGSGMCQTKEDQVPEFDANDIAVIAFLSTTGFIMLISTMYDMHCYYTKKEPAHIILIAFSVLTNGRKLLSVNKSSEQLGCLNGVRIISMIWVIIGHKYSVIPVLPNLNAGKTVDWIFDPANMYLLNATVSVDTFFVLSGLLVAYVFCLQMEKGIKFNVFMFYLHRYLRLTPVLAVVVWIQSSLITKLGSGPFWPFTNLFETRCVDYWWTTLLYIQNYYNPSEICVDPSWYLPVDMHLYILSPLILLPLWKWPKITVYGIVVLILGSMAIPFSITYAYELASFPIAGGAGAENYNAYYYMPTHTRFGPWLMGLLLGYYLFTLRKTKHSRIRLHIVEITFGWIVALALLGATVYGPYNIIKESTTLENAFVNGFYRHGWSLGVCWVIYACTQGYGGPINAFLSWSLFQVLGRFSYTLFLTHTLVLTMGVSSLRTSPYFTDFNTMYDFWSDFVAAFAVSFVLTIAYESPIMTIEKVIFGKGKATKKIDKSKTGHVNKGFEQA